MNDKKTPEYYLDWFCRVHEDAAAKSNRMLTDEARDAIRKIWIDHAKKAADMPAAYRLRHADFFHFCSEAAALMAKSADFSGGGAIDAAHVRSGTLAMLELAPGRAGCTAWPRSNPPVSEEAFRSRLLGLDTSSRET